MQNTRAGQVLREYLGDLAVAAAAAHLRARGVTLSRVLNGKAGIPAAMAIRLAAALSRSAHPMRIKLDISARKAKSPRFTRGFCTEHCPPTTLVVLDDVRHSNRTSQDDCVNGIAF